jgi:hypothetical protein
MPRNSDHNKAKDNEGPQFNDQGRIGRLKDQMYSRLRQPMKRPRRSLSGVELDLSDEWDRSSTPLEKQKHKLPRSYSFSSIFLVGAGLFFVVATAIAGVYIFGGANVISSKNIDMSVHGPRTIDGGDVLEMQVAVRNNNTVDLELADLVITYPPGTRMPSNLAANMTNQRIPLNSIEAGGMRTGTVRAVLFGQSGQRQTITVALEYRLKGSSALLYVETTHTVLVASDTLEVSLEANEEVVAGQQTSLDVTITSHAKTTVKDAILRATYPFGFSIEKTIPEASEEGLWLLGDFAPGESKTLRILGSLDGQTGDERIFRFVAGTRNTPDSITVDVVLSALEHTISIKRPFLDMRLTFDSRNSDSYIARTGEAIPVTLNWENNLSTALNDVIIAATLSGEGFDPYGISVEGGFYRSIDSVVLWDKNSTKSALKTIPAGETGNVSFRLVPRPSEQMLGVVDATINFELHAAAQRLSEDRVPETLQATVNESIKLATDVALAGRALYFENPLGSVGPLPPKVEHETTYGILWELSNTTSLVRDARVTATLPPYARWLGVVSPSVERVTFNENDGTITWHVGNLLPNIGVGDRSPRRIIFSIGLVPSTSQVGQVPPLIQNQLFVGTDNFTELSVEEPMKDLTTELGEVDYVDIYGRVVR